MIKLLIVDDEKTIRETIAKLIDWEKLGITLIGSAENGLDALNMILDESPEIVMTDIRMPGLSGLDLIRQIHSLNQDTRFIILSGYEEFEYAKEAMKYGIRHYLLKPCNEDQIVDAILSVKSDICQDLPSDVDGTTAYSLNEGIIFNIISKAFTKKCHNFREIYADYSSYIDLSNVPYTLHYIYYLEQGIFQDTIQKIDNELNKTCPELHSFYIYVENTLLLFYSSASDTYGHVDSTLKSTDLPFSGITPVFEIENFPSLSALLDKILPRIIRYEIIYFKMVHSIVSLSNSDSLIKQAENLVTQLLNSSGQYGTDQNCFSQLQDIFDSIHSLSLIQQIGNIIVTKILADKVTSASVSFAEISKFCQDFYQCKKTTDAQKLLIDLLNKTFLPHNGDEQGSLSDIASKVIDYVTENLADPYLSLKKISERVLFMNPDYVSKRFIKETGEKFSQFLTRTRMEYAKKLLAGQHELNVQKAAQETGYGNNPLYFSQLFKKYTSMTPSRYFKRTHPDSFSDI